MNLPLNLKLHIQCHYRGKKGSYLTDEQGYLFGEIFTDCLALFEWLRSNWVYTHEKHLTIIVYKKL